ncbi:MFS transporter [Candidatus Poribacteria bacterium]|nr:MFS transporter [Candidatus Poribacteria bacterium]
MKESTYRIYGYRWVVLFVYSLIQAAMQLLWITFAPITGDAVTYYGVTPLQIGLLSMSFMIVFIFVSIPASWAIDTFGIRKGVGFGVILAGIFALTRGVYGNNYNMVLASMIGIAIAQPFILNSITALAARWFPLDERATATGIGVLFQYIGMMVGMAATPHLTNSFGIPGMLRIYGIIFAVFSVSFLIFVKDKPATPPGETDIERTTVFEGLKHVFKQRDMILLLLIFFTGLGIFNAITTWVEQMIAPRGFSSVQAGTLGAVLMVGGIAGCFAIPPLSDKLRKRKMFIVLSAVITLPGLAGLAFAPTYALLLIAGFIMGFFFMSGGPVMYQYGAEITNPAPEATSQGLLTLSGQISGIIFIFGMDMFRTESGSMTPFLLVMMAMASTNIILALLLRESVMIKG